MQKPKSQFRNYLLTALIIFTLFLIAAPVFAAETFFETKTKEITANGQFDLGILINTDGDSINAIEGKIIFPQDLLEVKNISDGNSIVNFWIEKPKNVPEGQIAFSGIIPGGYNDHKGLVFSIIFLAKKEGSGIIDFKDVKALQNDGQGTETPLTVSNFKFLISKQVPFSQTITPIIEDRDPPEKFTPQVATNPTIFDGQWFLVFATEDKGSGIDHYEVQEGKRPFVVVGSPYLLQNQNLDEKITVKAVDMSGNERVVTLPAQNPLAWYKNYSIFAIIILGIALAYFIWKFLWKKQKKQNF